MRIVPTTLAFSLSLVAVAAAQSVPPRSPPPLNAPPYSAPAGAAPRAGVPAFRPRAPAGPACSGHGQLVSGVCACAPGWSGSSCEAAAGLVCNGRGQLVNGRCACSTFWMGPQCEMAGFSLTGPLFPD